MFHNEGVAIGMHALMLSYGVPEPDRAAHAELCEELAPAFAAVPGLVSKTWLVNPASGRYGAFYLFETKADFDRFVASELFETVRSRLGLRNVVATDFSVNRGPSALTRGFARPAAAALAKGASHA